MAERAVHPVFRQYTLEQADILQRFINVLGWVYRDDLDILQQVIIQDEHITVFHEAYRLGLIQELTEISTDFKLAMEEENGT